MNRSSASGVKNAEAPEPSPWSISKTTERLNDDEEFAVQ